jgi:hypothetical protein
MAFAIFRAVQISFSRVLRHLTEHSFTDADAEHSVKKLKPLRRADP